MHCLGVFGGRCFVFIIMASSQALQVDTIPKNYGFVVLVVILWFIYVTYMGHLVTKARKTYNVPVRDSL